MTGYIFLTPFLLFIVFGIFMLRGTSAIARTASESGPTANQSQQTDFARGINEVDSFENGSASSGFDDPYGSTEEAMLSGINPATGLSMGSDDGIDVGGNPYGTDLDQNFIDDYRASTILAGRIASLRNNTLSIAW